MAEIPEAVRGGTAKSPRPVTPHLLDDWQLPEPSGTKYSRGQALVIGGARGTPGGVLLAGRASLRTGAGRLSVAVAESVAQHVAVVLPECGARGLAEDEHGSVTGAGAGDALASELERADAVLVGPGLDDAAGPDQAHPGRAVLAPSSRSSSHTSRPARRSFSTPTGSRSCPT